MDRIEAIRKRQLNFALGIGIPYFAFVIGIFLLVYLAKGRGHPDQHPGLSPALLAGGGSHLPHHLGAVHLVRGQGQRH